MGFLAALPALGALGVAGAGVSAVGTVLGGIAAGNAASYQAQVARNNAIIAGNNATYAEQAGAAKAEAEGRKNAAVAGAIKSKQAANGIDVNTGSSVDVQTSQRETGELDAETVLNNAELQAYGYRTQQTGFESQAKLDEAQAAFAPIGAGLGAAGGLAANVSSIGSKWLTPSVAAS